MHDNNDKPRSRVHTDDRGRSVLDDTIRTGKFELVSTQKLKALLQDENHQHRDAVKRLAESTTDGFLAKDQATGHFSIIDDNDLQSLLDAQDGAAPAAAPADVTLEPLAGNSDDEDLSLVSTQALRKLLHIPEDKSQPKPASPKPVKDSVGGFDPYNSS